LVSFQPVASNSVACVFVDLSYNLQGPSLEGFTKLPDESAQLPASLRLVDAIRALDASCGLLFAVASLPAPFGDVAGQLDGVKWWHGRNASKR